jgi:2-hydroxychromene-2-carboxylate isomerase
MPQPHIDFWFNTGSTYTYLSAMRLPELARQSGVQVRWRAFHLRTLLAERNYFPFPPGSPKTAYMWRDIARRAKKHGLAPRLPAPYPLPDTLIANLVALVGMREGWGVPYVQASYRRWFECGEPSGAEPNLSASLAEVGQDAGRVARLAKSDEMQRALTAETDAARDAGLFGSPTFSVGGELFWGDDRLEDAIDCALHGAEHAALHQAAASA